MKMMLKFLAITISSVLNFLSAFYCFTTAFVLLGEQTVEFLPFVLLINAGIFMVINTKSLKSRLDKAGEA